MARKRQIDPEFCVDEDMAKISKEARLFYILSWTHAEDTGVLEYKPLTLKAKIFPYDDITIIPLIEELLCYEKYILYENSDKKKYLFIKNFHKHQIIQHPSNPKFPLPPMPYRDTIPEIVLKNASKELLSHTTHILLNEEYNRIELNRIELNRERLKDQPSKELKAALDKILNDGCNIYSLINRLKKESKVSADVPEAVLFKVCDSYWKNKPDIKSVWPWFSISIVQAWKDHNANNHELESKTANKRAPMASSIKNILEAKNA